MSAAEDRNPASFVPHEFRGLARAFRSRVEAADLQRGVVLPRVLEPLQRRLFKSPIFRRETLIDAERDWAKLLPTFGRVAVEHNFTDLRAPQFAELRVIGSTHRLDEWEEGKREPGVAVAWVSIGVQNRSWSASTRIVAILALHALARRIQRGRDQSDEALMKDIAALAALPLPSPTNIPATKHFVAALDDGAEWRGRYFNLKGQILLGTRTYFDPDHATIGGPPGFWRSDGPQ